MKTQLKVGDIVLIAPEYYYQHIKLGEVLKRSNGLLEVGLSRGTISKVPEDRVLKVLKLRNSIPLEKYAIRESTVKNPADFRGFFKEHFERCLQQLNT